MKRSNYYILTVFILLPSLLALPTSSFTIPYQASIAYTTPSGISNHIFYLCVDISGTAQIGLESQGFSLNISSISTYITDNGVIPLPLNGTAISTPKVVDTTEVFFIYIPGVNSITPQNLNITASYLAYSNFTGNNWGKVVNVITQGVTTDFSVYDNKIYAIWRPYYNSSESYLLTITPQGNIVSNISLGIKNALLITVSNDELGVVENGSVSQILSNLQSISSKINIGDFFVINMTTGKILYEIPQFNGLNPSGVSVNKEGLLLVSYSTNTFSYLVLYNLSNGKIISSSSFSTVTVGFINGNYILAEEFQKGFASIITTIVVYNLSWSPIYNKTENSLTTYQLADGLFINSTGVFALITQINSQASLSQILVSSSIKLINILSPPSRFSIYVTQEHHPGYTLLNISWNENQQAKFMVYVNSTLIKVTDKHFIQLNITENSTLEIKIVAINQLGNVSENFTVKVIVYPKTTVQSTTTQYSNTTTTISSTSNTTPPSSTTTTSSSLATYITPSSSTEGTTTSKVPQGTLKTPSSSTQSSYLLPPQNLVTIMIIIGVVAIIGLLLKRKI